MNACVHIQHARGLSGTGLLAHGNVRRSQQVARSVVWCGLSCGWGVMCDPPYVHEVFRLLQAVRRRHSGGQASERLAC